MKSRPRLSLLALESRINPADLAIANAYLVDPSGNLDPTPVVGQRIGIRAEWTTDALSSANQYVVRYWVDGVPANSATQTGQAGNGLWFNWYREGWYIGAGTHTITVQVDGTGQVAETDETNNTFEFNVTTIAPTTLPAKFSPPIGGRPFEDWSIVNYADVVPSGATADFRGGEFNYNGHDAWDVTLPNFERMDAGVPNLAAANGVVTQVVDGNFDRESSGNSNQGNYVVIDHGNGWETMYYHLAAGTITVAVGDTVARGHLLGLAGSSGSSTDAHIHFTPFYRGMQVETMYDPPAYWFDPPEYQGDLPTTVTAAGIANADPFPDFKEGPAEATTFSTTGGQDVWFWYRMSHLNAGDQLRVRWFRPNGSVQTTYGYDATGVERYMGHGWNLNPGAYAAFPGVWHVAVVVNGVELERRAFTVTTDAGPAVIRLAQAGTYVIDGRTTPIDFGSVAAGSAAVNRNFVVRNLGTSPLSLSDLKLPPNFSLVGPLPAGIAAGATATLTLRMETPFAGVQWGEVSFATNDPNRPTFRFAIRGVVTGTAPAGAPELTAGGPARPYTLGRPPVLLAPGAAVVDTGGTGFAGGSVTAAIGFGSAAGDLLGVADGGGITVVGGTVSYLGTAVGTLTGGTGGVPLTVSLNAAADDATVQALVRRITFANADRAAPTNVRRVRLTLVDGDGNASTHANKRVVAYPPLGPDVAAVGPVAPNPRNTPVSSVTVLFTQPLLAGSFDAADVSLTRDGGPNLINGGVTITPLGGNAYRIDGLAGLTAAAGEYTLTVSAGGVSNVPGFIGEGSGSTTWNVDATPPTVTVEQAVGQTDPTNEAAIEFEVRFSEPVVGFDASAVTLSGSAGGTLVAAVSPGSEPNSFVVTVTGMASPGTVIAAVDAGVVSDVAGNGNLASTGSDNSVLFDNDAPGVSITPTGTGPFGGTAVTFDVVFDEPVVGFDATKIGLAGTTAPGASVAVSGTGPAYVVTVSGMTAGGTVAVSVLAAAGTDAAGNASAAVGPASVTYVRSGMVRFSAPAFTIAKGQAAVTITATRTDGAEGPITVAYSAIDGTALLGVHYGAPLGGGTLSWANGDTGDKTFVVPLIDYPESATRTFSVQLADASLPGALGTPDTATVSILKRGVVEFAVAEQTVEEGDGTVVVFVRRLLDWTGDASVSFVIDGGTATAGTDYTATGGTLTWLDGDTADARIEIDLVDDDLSEGDETIRLTLTAVTGNVALGSATSATLTIRRSEGVTIDATLQKPVARLVDEDGDAVSLKLAGKAGTLTYYLTDGAMPIARIDLAGTSSAKSVVRLGVRKAPGGDGRVEIGTIEGSGAKSLALAKVDLVGGGIDLTGYVGSLAVGDVRNGADIALAGAPPKPGKGTRVTVGVLGDGTDLSVAGAPLASLTAVRVGDGSITAPSVGAIKVKGRPEGKQGPAVAGDFLADLTITAGGLGSLKVAGGVTASSLRVTGDVGKVIVGSFVDSRLFAGYSGDDDATGSFNGTSTVGGFKVTGKSAAFARSYVIADTLRNVLVASLDDANGGVDFGFVFRTAASRLVVADQPPYTYVPGGPTELAIGEDFVIRKV